MRINYAKQQLIDQETMNQSEIEFAVRKTKLNFQSQKLATEEYLVKIKQELEVVKTTYPLDLQKVCDLTDEVANNEKLLKTLENLAKEFNF